MHASTLTAGVAAAVTAIGGGTNPTGTTANQPVDTQSLVAKSAVAKSVFNTADDDVMAMLATAKPKANYVKDPIFAAIGVVSAPA